MRQGALSEQALKNLQSHSPGVILNIVTQYNGGNINMDHRKVEGSFNNSDLKGNIAIQADNVTQTQNINKDESEQAFRELFDAIQKLENETEREQAHFFAEQMQEALESGDKTKGQKMLQFLQGALGAASSLATVAQLFGLTIPLP